MPTNTPPLQPYHAAGLAAVLGTFIGLNSTYGILSPGGALRQLGFRTAVSPSDKELTEGLLRMFSATRVVVGVSQVAAWWYGDYKVLGCQMVASALMAAVDGWVSKSVSGKGQWAHWGALPVGLSIGVWLLQA